MATNQSRNPSSLSKKYRRFYGFTQRWERSVDQVLDRAKKSNRKEINSESECNEQQMTKRRKLVCRITLISISRTISYGLTKYNIALPQFIGAKRSNSYHFVQLCHTWLQHVDSNPHKQMNVYEDAFTNFESFDKQKRINWQSNICMRRLIHTHAHEIYTNVCNIWKNSKAEKDLLRVTWSITRETRRTQFFLFCCESSRPGIGALCGERQRERGGGEVRVSVRIEIWKRRQKREQTRHVSCDTCPTLIREAGERCVRTIHVIRPGDDTWHRVWTWN